jgi:hypothetical protein
MHKTLRFFAVLGAAAGIYLAAALQSGPSQVDANICATARRWQLTVPDQCAPWIDNWARGAIWLVIVLCVGFLAWDVVSFLRRRPPRQKRASHSQLFIGIMEAIYWIAEKSAWGRWQDAQRCASGGALSELFKFSDAERVLRTAAENGELLIRGREKKSIEYKDFDQHFWRTAFFDIQKNPASIWQASVKAMPATNVEIPEYDAAIVEKTRIETLWRQRDWRYDWPRLRLNLSSAWKRMKDSPKPPAVETSQGSEVPRAAEASATLAGSTTLQAETTIEISVTPLAPENWKRLFVIGDDGRSVWLRFLPDTKHYRADTLLLVVYRQKILRDVPRVRIEAAHAAVEKTVHNAPNQPKTSSGLFASMIVMQHLGAAVNRDWVDECVPFYMQRVGLSQGGFYQLTERGESHAAALVYDLIQRA